MVKEEVIRPEGWYCPRVLSKWQTSTQNEVESILVAGGDYYEMSKYYRFSVVSLALKTDGRFPPEPAQPKPQVIANQDPAVSYTGDWHFDSSRSKAASGGEYFSKTMGDTITINFSGTQLKWYASKENNLGIAGVSIDNGLFVEIDQYTYCQVAQYQRLVFESWPLKAGQHTIRIRVTGKKNPSSTGFGIFHDRLEVV